VHFLNFSAESNSETQKSNFLLVVDKEGNFEVFYLECENNFDIVEGRIMARPKSMLQNRKSLFHFARKIVPYFEGEFSFAWFESIKKLNDPKFFFKKDGSILSIDKDCKTNQIKFDTIFGGSSVSEEISNGLSLANI